MRLIFPFIIILILSSCHTPQIEERPLLDFESGIKLKTVCDTSRVFALDVPLCNWIIEGCGLNEKDNNRINEFGYYQVYDSTIIFYSDFQYGVTFGWHNIQNGNSIGFPKIEKIYSDSIQQKKSYYFYRNGLIYNGDSIADPLIDFGTENKIETPNHKRYFGVYKLEPSTKELKLVSRDYNYDLNSNDGIYYITLPGLIKHHQIDIYCE